MYKQSAPEAIASLAVMPSYTPGATTVFEGSESSDRSFLPAETGLSACPFVCPFMVVNRSLTFLVQGRNELVENGIRQ